MEMNKSPITLTAYKKLRKKKIKSVNSITIHRLLPCTLDYTTAMQHVSLQSYLKYITHMNINDHDNYMYITQ